jgi:hypothetical protein
MTFFLTALSSALTAATTAPPAASISFSSMRLSALAVHVLTKVRTDLFRNRFLSTLASLAKVPPQHPGDL